LAITGDVKSLEANTVEKCIDTVGNCDSGVTVANEGSAVARGTGDVKTYDTNLNERGFDVVERFCIVGDSAGVPEDDFIKYVCRLMLIDSFDSKLTDDISLVEFTDELECVVELMIVSAIIAEVGCILRDDGELATV
jgi:hypothetical protein